MLILFRLLYIIFVSSCDWIVAAVPPPPPPPTPLPPLPHRHWGCTSSSSFSIHAHVESTATFGLQAKTALAMPDCPPETRMLSLLSHDIFHLSFFSQHYDHQTFQTNIFGSNVIYSASTLLPDNILPNT
jgi:hypothetical protein